MEVANSKEPWLDSCSWPRSVTYIFSVTAQLAQPFAFQHSFSMCLWDEGTAYSSRAQSLAKLLVNATGCDLGLGEQRDRTMEDTIC